MTAEEPVECEITVRIPGTAKSAVLGEKQEQPGSFAVAGKSWKGTKRIPLRLEMEEKLISRPGGAAALTRGPLVFSLPVSDIAGLRTLEEETE